MVTFFVFARLTDESNEEKIPLEKSLFDLVTLVVFQKVCLCRHLQILQICKYSYSCFQIHTPRRVVLIFVL